MALIYTASLYPESGAMQVSKWGNSLAIRLPAAIVEIMGLKAGDDVEVKVAGSSKIELSRSADTHEMLMRLRRYRGRLPADFKFDREEANDRGR